MRRGLIAAAVLTLAADAFVLSGVAYNRSRVVRRVSLSEWEMPLDYRDADNSGVSLHFDHVPGNSSFLNVRSVIDEQKLAALGFEPKDSPPGRFDPPASRPAFAAFDIGGPRWAQWARDFVENALRANASMHLPVPVSPPVPPKTRLILADVAREPETLLAKYPDDLILRVEVSPYRTAPNQGGRWMGLVSEILPAHVHVPVPLSGTLRSIPQYQTDKAPRYYVTLCTGRRNQVWIESVTLP